MIQEFRIFKTVGRQDLCVFGIGDMFCISTRRWLLHDGVSHVRVPDAQPSLSGSCIQALQCPRQRGDKRYGGDRTITPRGFKPGLGGAEQSGLLMTTAPSLLAQQGNLSVKKQMRQ
jgi:hypothetical protein